MFERFTRDARAAVVLAQDEARSRRDSRIGSEHLLITVAMVNPAISAAVGLDVDDLRNALVTLDREALDSVGVVADPELVGQTPSKKGHIPFTGSAKKIMENALREAMGHHDRRIGVEHLLLGIASLPPQDRACRVLAAAGHDPSSLRASVETYLRRAS